MLNLVLFEPEIPNNTGSLIRLSANMGVRTRLHWQGNTFKSIQYCLR
jgi:tRNA(Leu) C34 or U34 (ribose-2'-O)-methylase TrmL